MKTKKNPIKRSLDSFYRLLTTYNLMNIAYKNIIRLLQSKYAKRIEVYVTYVLLPYNIINFIPYADG